VSPRALYVYGHFVPYDSTNSGATTEAQLRFKINLHVYRKDQLPFPFAYDASRRQETRGLSLH
jgi:hypothetical protein